MCVCGNAFIYASLIFEYTHIHICTYTHMYALGSRIKMVPSMMASGQMDYDMDQAFTAHLKAIRTRANG